MTILASHKPGINAEWPTKIKNKKGPIISQTAIYIFIQKYTKQNQKQNQKTRGPWALKRSPKQPKSFLADVLYTVS